MLEHELKKMKGTVKESENRKGQEARRRDQREDEEAREDEWKKTKKNRRLAQAEAREARIQRELEATKSFGPNMDNDMRIRIKNLQNQLDKKNRADKIQEQMRLQEIWNIEGQAQLVEGDQKVLNGNVQKWEILWWKKIEEFKRLRIWFVNRRKSLENWQIFKNNQELQQWMKGMDIWMIQRLSSKIWERN